MDVGFGPLDDSQRRLAEYLLSQRGLNGSDKDTLLAAMLDTPVEDIPKRIGVSPRTVARSLAKLDSRLVTTLTTTTLSVVTTLSDSARSLNSEACTNPSVPPRNIYNTQVLREGSGGREEGTSLNAFGEQRSREISRAELERCMADARARTKYRDPDCFVSTTPVYDEGEPTPSKLIRDEDERPDFVAATQRVIDEFGAEREAALAAKRDSHPPEKTNSDSFSFETEFRKLTGFGLLPGMAERWREEPDFDERTCLKQIKASLAYQAAHPHQRARGVNFWDKAVTRWISSGWLRPEQQRGAT